jgi:hypothetical protein
MKSVLLAALGALLGFLMGAFYNAGFDIALWSDSSRFATLLVMSMLSILFVAVDQIMKIGAP